MIKIRVGSRIVDLQEKDFVDSGGMAKIYEQNGIAYKIVNDMSKFDISLVNSLVELRGNSYLIIPQDVIYDYDSNIPCGYTAPFLKNSLPMAVFFAMEAWNDHNLKVGEANQIVEQLYNSIIRYIHSKGFVHGDPNPMNFLIFKKADKTDIAAIDLDGISKDPTKIGAVSPVVFDYQTNKFCQKSDIFGTAVSSFWFYTGFHPYRPKHPGLSENILTKGIVDRMKRNLSVFSPGAILPTGCRGLDGIPTDLLEYYEDVFFRGSRKYIPDAIGTKKPGRLAKKVSTSISTSTAAVKFTLEESLASNIEDAIFVENKWYFRITGESQFIVIKGKKIYTDVIVNQSLQLNSKVSFIRDNKLFVISNSGTELSEVSYVLFSDLPVFAIKRTMAISKASKFFSGCLAASFFQSLIIIDTMALSVLNVNGRLLNLKAYQNIVFIIVELGNIFKRYIVNTVTNDILLEEEVTSTDINSIVLKNGIIIELCHQEITMFHKDNISKNKKVQFKNDMRLITNGTGLYGIFYNYFYKIEIT